MMKKTLKQRRMDIFSMLKSKFSDVSMTPSQKGDQRRPPNRGKSFN
jgi:hypothetical protein